MIRTNGFAFAAVLGIGGASAALSAGCAEPAFSAHLRDNNVEDIARATALAGEASGQARSATAFLLTAGEPHLVAYDLGGAAVRWDIAADVKSRIAVGRGFIAHRQGNGQIAVRSADSGALRCTVALKADEQFLGIAADTRLYYVVQTLTGATRVASVTAVAADTCAPLWRDEASMSMGAPAVRGDLLAVPYAYQNVVLLDGKTGHEVARVRATDEQVSYVRATPEALYYGDDKGVYLFDQKSAAGSKQGSDYAGAHLASSQIRTFFYWDGYQPAQSDYTAFDRNRVIWRTEQREGGKLGFRDGQAVLHNFRYFFAFDEKTGALRWAYAHPRVDLVASEHTGPAVLFASTDGELGALDAKTGAATWSMKTGIKIAHATFDADGFAPPANPAAKAPALLQTLSDIITDPNTSFAAVKVFSIASLTRMPGSAVTELLVKIVTRDGVAPAVAKAAGEALVARQDQEARGIYREALSVRTDYLADRRAVGVDVLAKVVAAASDKDAIPLLVSHLLDAATPGPALKEIVRALTSLGGTQAVAGLRDFLLTYRSDSTFNSDPSSLQLAVDGLLAGDAAEGRRIAFYVASDKRTLPALQSYILRALSATPVAVAKVTSTTPVGATTSPTAPVGAAAAKSGATAAAKTGATAAAKTGATAR